MSPRGLTKGRKPLFAARTNDERDAGPGSRHAAWLAALRIYFVVIIAGNLLWEAFHMPLYTVWREEEMSTIVVYGLHCTAGDILIALATLIGPLLVLGHPAWPERGFRGVAASAIALGVGYTAFSEWWNVEVQQSWAYTEAMPTIGATGIGLSPILQWLVVPGIAFWLVRRLRRTGDRSAVPTAGTRSADGYRQERSAESG
ncbi:hypothetical protein [Ferruginivarius sediminum]|uniref:hypothetical protein n=1 Tax=Ferruginivarius sediminum TaxID=2661937 RepID=UPI00187BB767|nr:hypothetical protein [Ferruginivarius sediminum]